MGLLNHLFGKKENIAKELIIDRDKRIALWDKHLADFSKKEELSKKFNFKKVDESIADWERTVETLNQIESLISSEVISIGQEEKIDAEIIADINSLKSTSEIQKQTQELVYEARKQKSLINIFHEIHDVLKSELHLLRAIKKKPANSRELLLELFKLIFFNEALLYKPFRDESYFDKSNHDNIYRLARSIILGEEIKEEIESDEAKFVRQMEKQMIQGETRRRYSLLAEEIFSRIAAAAGAPMLRADDILQAIEKMEGLMQNDSFMHEVIKNLRPKYDDTKIRVVILAFRKAYHLGHFDEMQSEFIT